MFRSWMAATAVRPRARTRSISWSWYLISRWLVGSSKIRQGVSWTRARAMSTRCFSPPDRVVKLCSRMLCSWVRRRIWSTRARSWSFSDSRRPLRAWRPIMMTSSTVKSKPPSCSWITTARRWAISRLLMASRSSPIRVMEPDWGWRTLYIFFSRVDFPLPLGPMTPTNSPSWTSSPAPWRITRGPAA